jgi:hypothetical protein
VAQQGAAALQQTADGVQQDCAFAVVVDEAQQTAPGLQQAASGVQHEAETAVLAVVAQQGEAVAQHAACAAQQLELLEFRFAFSRGERARLEACRLSATAVTAMPIMARTFRVFMFFVLFFLFPARRIVWDRRTLTLITTPQPGKSRRFFLCLGFCLF